jgi:hypothetical protein
MTAPAVPAAPQLTGSITISPLEVAHWMGRAPFRYPARNEAEQYAGWRHYPAIPGLFALTARLGRFVRPAEGVAHLMANCDEGCATNPKVQRRAEKLYLDFARDMHTLGLLQQAQLFGYIAYQKALDLTLNVDYVAALLSFLVPTDDETQVGIQAQMRAQWPDPWAAAKAQRRARHKVGEWTGKLYHLTNEHRRAVARIAGCWLFTPAHINDLAEQVRGDIQAASMAPHVGIQARLLD